MIMYDDAWSLKNDGYNLEFISDRNIRIEEFP